MGESSSGKWYTNPAVIEVLKIVGAVVVAIITGVFLVIAAFISTKQGTVVQPIPPQPVSTTPPAPLQKPPEVPGNDAAKTEVEPTVIQSEYPAENEESTAESKPEPIEIFHYDFEELTEGKAEPLETFHDDFEGGLKDWRIKRYSGYNNFMRWHISDKEHASGKSCLALGHQDTSKKENNDTVHIETKKELFLTENAVLLFKIKKTYKINLEIVLKNKVAPFKDTVIKFYPGNDMYKDWRAEEIYLGLYIDEGRYTLMLRAWDQGSLYLDDIKIQK